MIDIEGHNRDAWDAQVRKGNPWTVPVTADAVQRAREVRHSLPMQTPPR